MRGRYRFQRTRSFSPLERETAFLFLTIQIEYLSFDGAGSVPENRYVAIGF